MFKAWRWQIVLGLALVGLSALLSAAHYLIFHQAHDIAFYLLMNIAFLPLEVLLVTLILHQLLNFREKRSRLRKLNMVIGAFYSEVGRRLLAGLAALDRDLDQFRPELQVSDSWTARRFATAISQAHNRPCRLVWQLDDVLLLRDFLRGHRDFMLRLLENPNLLEHETFSDLLWAVFHLTDELVLREQLAEATEKDREHLTGDMKRAYGLLIAEWLAYMQHLKNDYPYLFSLAQRTNPFVPDLQVEIR